MSLKKQCEHCGTELLSDADGPLCPRCVAAAKVDPSSSPPVSGSGTPGGWPAGLHLRPRLPDFGDYTNIHEIDSGGMGIVYKALQKKANRWSSSRCP